MTWRSNLRTIGEDDRVNALLAQTAGRLTLQDAQGTTDKGEKPLGLDMPFSKALERFIGVDPEQLPDRVKLPQKRGRRSDPRCCEKKLRLSAKRRESAPERVRHVQSECDNTRRCRA